MQGTKITAREHGIADGELWGYDCSNPYTDPHLRAAWFAGWRDVQQRDVPRSTHALKGTRLKWVDAFGNRHARSFTFGQYEGSYEGLRAFPRGAAPTRRERARRRIADAERAIAVGETAG